MFIKNVDEQLKHDIDNILRFGFYDENPRPKYEDGTPAHTLSVNHVIRQYDLSTGDLPICTLRYIAWKSAVKELLWIYQDQSNSLEVLNNKYGVVYWNNWESQDEKGTIGQRYGATVKKYNLINRLLENLTNDPFGRRHVLDLWQESDFEETDGLKPCAFCTIWNVRKEDGFMYLDLLLNQRSGDMLTASGAGGINEIQYIVLQHLVARHCGFFVCKFTHIVANEQIYNRHVENARILTKRDSVGCQPRLILNPEKKNFFDFTIDDIQIEDYDREKINAINPQLKFELGI